MGSFLLVLGLVCLYLAVRKITPLFWSKDSKALYKKLKGLEFFMVSMRNNKAVSSCGKYAIKKTSRGLSVRYYLRELDPISSEERAEGFRQTFRDIGFIQSNRLPNPISKTLAEAKSKAKKKDKDFKNQLKQERDQNLCQFVS